MLLQPRFLQRRCLLGRGRGVRRQSGERTGRTRRCRQTGSAARKGRVGIWRHVVSGTSYIRVQVNRTKKKQNRTFRHGLAFGPNQFLENTGNRSLRVFFIFFFYIGTVREKTSGHDVFLFAKTNVLIALYNFEILTGEGVCPSIRSTQYIDPRKRSVIFQRLHTIIL